MPAGPENGISEVVTARDDQTHLAAFAVRVYRSGDGGQTWLPVPAE
ncbi:hypothetical protein AA0Y32_17220 [Georgenia phoenicis]